MSLIDLHCDTAFLMSVMQEPIELRKNNLCVDLEKMKRADSMAQFFASFIHMKRFGGDFDKAYEAALAMLRKTKEAIEKNSDMIRLARNYDELMKNYNNGLMSGVLTIEEGGIIDNRMERLEELYKEGTDEAAIEAGKLLVKEILFNTDDRTGLIAKCEKGGVLNEIG